MGRLVSGLSLRGLLFLSNLDAEWPAPERAYLFGNLANRAADRVVVHARFVADRRDRYFFVCGANRTRPKMPSCSTFGPAVKVEDEGRVTMGTGVARASTPSDLAT